jgi:ubiquitin C-terminal hydrolase
MEIFHTTFTANGCAIITATICNKSAATVSMYGYAPIPADSVSTVSVIPGLPRPKTKWKIKEINGS